MWFRLSRKSGFPYSSGVPCARFLLCPIIKNTITKTSFLLHSRSVVRVVTTDSVVSVVTTHSVVSVVTTDSVVSVVTTHSVVSVVTPVHYI